MKLLVALVLVCAPALVVADTPAPPAIKLVTAGKDPRTQLRFAPKKGTKRTVVVTSQEAKARGVKGKLPPLATAPAIRMTMDLEITDVTADGDIHYQFVYRGAELADAKGLTPELDRQVKKALAVFNGLKGHGIATSRGISKLLELETPANAQPEARAAIEMSRGVVSQIVEPLPEDAVGLGAKWQTTSTVTTGEITANTTVSHELLELSGTRAKIKLTMTVHGKGSGPGNLTSETTATGETVLDLTAIVPSQAKLDMRTEVGLDMDGKRLAQLGTTKVTLVAR
ncbi:MAG TPA: hypothetical protein VFQ53_36590 [Kofleriaceae bacterium]|nr:hypothetical protein [Kofleriaceae bacterium]